MAIKAGKWEMSDEEFERQYAEATQRGQAETAKGAYAVAARYDKVRRRIVVELANGVTLLVPPQLIRGLQAAATTDLAEIEIIGVGSGLHWPQLSVDIGVAGLLNRVLSTSADDEGEAPLNSTAAHNRRRAA